MNRHARRRAAKAAWAAGIGAVAVEAAGRLDISIIRPTDAGPLILAALAGDRDAQRLLTATQDVARRVRTAGRGADAVMCGCCDNLLIDTAHSVVVAAPYRDDPARCIVMGICVQCATDDVAIKRKTFQALRRIFPDGRAVQLQQHAAGRA